MATVESLEVVRETIRNRGMGNPGEPPVIAAFRYRHADTSKTLFMLAFDIVDIGALLISSLCQNVELLWQSERGLSDAGTRFMNGDDTPTTKQDADITAMRTWLESITNKRRIM